MQATKPDEVATGSERAPGVEMVAIHDRGVQAACAEAREAGVAALVSNYYLLQAIAALGASGMLDRLERGPGADADLTRGLDEPLATALLDYLVIRGVLARTDGLYALSDRGRLLARALPRGLAGYHVEAYGPVMQRIVPLLRREQTYGVDVERNGAALARHCGPMTRTLILPTALRILRRARSRLLLDLGCGDAGFLIDACAADPGLRGIGLDISEGCLSEARARLRDVHLDDRVEVVQGDAFDPSSWPASCRQADAMVAIGTLHERFRDGEEAVVSVLREYGRIMASAGSRFVLVEPELWRDQTDAEFFLIHALTRQGMPRRCADWLDVIARSGLRCTEVSSVPDVPFRFVFFELVPA
jgi:SAM-dependent methyltransferase